MARSLIFGGCLLILLLSGCRKDPLGTRWNSDLLFPVLKTNLTVSNIVSDTLLVANSDNSLKLVYDQSFYSLDLDSLLNMPDTTIRNQFALIFGSVQASPGQQILALNQETKYNLNQIKLSRVIIKTGEIAYTIKSHIKGKTLIKFKLPHAKLNGVPFEILKELPAATSTTLATYTSTFDLSGYDIDLRGMNSNQTNTIYTQIEAYISSNGDTTQLTNSDSIAFIYSFKNVEPSYGKGYFGSYSFQIPLDSEGFDLFKSISSGSLGIENIDLDLYIKNSVGVDARVKLKELKSFNSRTGNTVSLTHSLIGNSLNVSRALEQPHTPTHIHNYLNSTNSNVKALIENLPDQIQYALDIDINPLGNVTHGNDFIFTDKGFETGLMMEMPLAVSLGELTLSDTIEMQLDSGGFANRYKGGRFFILADNMFPFSALPKFYILNDAGQITDSLMTNGGLLEAAEADGNGIVTLAKHSELTFEADEQKFRQVLNAKKILVKVTFNTSSNPSYKKIYSNYGMSLQLTANPILELNYK